MTMDLICTEKAISEVHYQSVHDRLALRDTALFDESSRVLRNLLELEEHQKNHSVDARLFQRVQTDLQPNMRRIVANWMLEVSDTELCRAEVFPHAMHLLDRFLSKKMVQKNHLQLLGTVCLLLASKMRLTRPLTVEKLRMYTDYSVNCQEILEWEMLVLLTLDWNTACVIANDLLDQLVHRLPLDSQHQRQKETLRKQAQTVIALTATEFKFSHYIPSIVAAASMVVASGYVLRLSRRQKSDMMKWAQLAVRADEEELRVCTEAIDDFITKNFAPQVPAEDSAPPAGPVEVHHKVKEDIAVTNQGQPETPTDVQDVLSDF
ncbi:G1/S-specific cyclin-D2-like [Varroa jacobsoni]|uniref:Cyclin N-terminal domain-containing protein n=1 Tax=Varroa destructor TaxID=109461 RepID=A0A7M7JZE1_VARDE|nr:G1/S-specific cyclin-D2-like [Varroa destructor]XP_022711741.1 G1/S-specific cyclin-D2-like [Varroa jacobsoni]